MKAKSLVIDNFGKFGHIKVDFDDNVTYIVGPNGAGKSTIGINAIWYIFQGVSQKGTSLQGERFRFIGDDKPSTTNTLLLEDEELGVQISIRRTMTKSGHKVEFIAPPEMSLDQKWLDEIFNVFLIAPQKFIDLSPKQQAIELGIDTAEFDGEIKALKEEYTVINRQITAIGDVIEVEKTEAINIAEKMKQMSAINAKLKEQEANETKLFDVQKEIIELEEKIKNKRTEQDALISLLEAFDKNYYTQAENLNKELDTIDEINAKAQKYTEYVKEKEKKDKLQTELANNKQRQKDSLAKKVEYIGKFDLPFKNMEINEEGELLLDGKPIKEPYFSSGELLKKVPVIMAKVSKSPLKYVFLQHFNLLDENNQAEVIKNLVDQGFQVVVEVVDMNGKPDKNVIVLKDCEIVGGETEYSVEEGEVV